jgi:hypothetical protein
VIDRREVLESVVIDPRATPADRMRALESLDRLADGDGRVFSRAEIEDLSDEELDALLAEPMSVQDSAERIAREIVASREDFNALARQVAEQLVADARLEAQDATRRADAAETALAQARSQGDVPRRQRRSQTAATNVDGDAVHNAEIVALREWDDRPRRPFPRP